MLFSLVSTYHSESVGDIPTSRIIIVLDKQELIIVSSTWIIQRKTAGEPAFPADSLIF